MGTRYGDFAPEDLTAQARIREAALRLFGSQGYAGTSIRAVAKEAGVSPALVQRHFGTKDGLRQACDTYALGSLLDYADRAAEGATARPDFVADMFESGQTSGAYLARALAEGWSTAAAFFDQGAEATERFLTSTWPDRFPAGSEHTRETAAVMAAMHSGVLVLHAHVSRRLGADVLVPDQAGRIGAAIGAVYGAMGEYMASATGAQIRKATEEYSRSRDEDGERR